MKKFLVTDLVPPACIETLQQLGFEVDHIEDMSNAQLAEIIPLYTGLVVRTSLIMDKAMLDKAINLKYILRPGSGMDNIDVPYAEQKGIKLFNSPEANADAVAEHAMGLLLGLMNYIPRAMQSVKEGKWMRQANTGVLLKGKTVGIFGYGHTGAAFAKKLSGFDVNILAFDKYKTGYSTAGVSESGMVEIFDQADIISFHIPLNAETNHLVNADFLSRFRKPVYLINTSRGKIVDTYAIISALKTKKLNGAGLDVLENENFASYSEEEEALLQDLFNSGNVIVTPHIAGWTAESRDNIFYVVVEKFRKFMQW